MYKPLKGECNPFVMCERFHLSSSAVLFISWVFQMIQKKAVLLDLISEGEIFHTLVSYFI